MKKIKQTLSLVIAVTMSAMCPLTMWADITPTAPTGTGTESDPYQISTKEELYWFADKINQEYETYSNVCARLTNDIVVNDGTFSADGEFTATDATETSTPISWTPIRGQEITAGWYDGRIFYSGTFDGDGHTVSGLYCNSSEEYIGLFGVNSGTVKNVGIVNSYIKGKLDVGGICGFCYRGSITNCYTTCNINGSYNVGGICGDAEEETEISHCYSTGNVVCDNNGAGGICGKSSSNISNCYATGDIGIDIDGTYAQSSCGGICGIIDEGTISNCYASCNIMCQSNWAGICGSNYYGGINNCYTSETDIVGLQYGSTENSESSVDFSTGRICYILNGSTSEGTLMWYQKLGDDGDASPVFANTGENTVYFGYADCTATEKSVYSNDADYEIQGQHMSDKHGYCKRCGEELSSAKNFVLTDGETYNRTTQCAATKLTYSRTFSNTNWQALYVPFAMAYDDFSNELEIAKLNDIHQYDDDDNGEPDRTTLEFYIMHKGSTEPNTPYLVRAKATETFNLTLDDVEVSAATCNSYECSNFTRKFTIYGTYSGVDGADMVSNHYYAPVNGSLKYASSSSASLKSQRWYLQVTNKDGSAVADLAPSIRLTVDGNMIEEEETAISQISDIKSSESFYTLDGRRMAKPSEPGIYVHNNKKIIVR